MQHLHDPENGCPWDKEQTFATITSYTLEETYETLNTIARESFNDPRGELGDLLFWAVSYTQMAQEEGRFDFNNICAAINDKLERRHPHVLAGSSAENSSEAFARWEQIKTRERAQKAQRSTLDDISRSLPALVHAQKIQRRCVDVSFDWTAFGPVVNKVYEEIDEMVYKARQVVAGRAELEEEVEDLLLAMVDLARHLGIKAEIALQKTNEEFERRSREVGRVVAVRGLEMTDVDLEIAEEIWQQVKRQEIDL